jgi:hypothetical protein
MSDGRELFHLYRTGIQVEPRILKAVRAAEADDVLGPELHAQLDFDEQIVSALKSIQPPPNLAAKLTGPTPKRSKARHALNPAILSAALGLVLIVGFAIYLAREAASDFAGRDWIEKFIEMNNRMTGAELERTQLTAGDLADPMILAGFPGFAVPRELAARPADGWRVFRQGQAAHRVAQFTLTGTKVVAFVFRASDFGVQSEAADRWRTFTHEGWIAAVTERGGLCTVLTLRGEEAEMRAFLDTLK